jgi:hypothetical protein
MPKIISLSRKGFDSKFGGVASPIIDNKVYSLPIPSDETQIFNPKYSKKYKDLKFGNLSGSEILEKLQKTPLHPKKGNKKRNEITPESLCHNDPDLNNGIYGAAGNASLQLKNFKEGDLLLFFGWFFDKDGEKRHIHHLFGWLQADYIIRGKEKIKDFCNKNNIVHPHADEVFLNDETNALYVSSGDVVTGDSLGYGKFENFHPELCLTHPLSTKRSIWQLNKNYFSEIVSAKDAAEIFKTYIKEESFTYKPGKRSKTNDPLIRDDKLAFKSPDIGQEIFMDGSNKKVDQWARDLIKTHGTQIRRKKYTF